MNKKIFNSPMIKSISSNQENNIESKIIYHYTSPEAFLNIIKGKSVRFSDVLYLNDNSEKKYIVKILIEFCEKYNEKYPFFSKAVNELLKNNINQELKDLTADAIKFNEETIVPYKQDRTFVFCASNDCDSLNMWNYYVNNGKYQGYSIGINTKSFLKTFDTDVPNHIDSFIVYYGDVLYTEKEQFNEIAFLAESIENNNSLNDKMNFDAAMLKIRAYIDLQGAFYKSPKFKSENEYRILISIDNDRIPRKKNDGEKYFGENNKKIMEGFSTKYGLIVPFLDVTLPIDAISRVYTAPMVEYQIAKLSAKELLDTYDYKYNQKSVSVIKSQIPIRF